MEKKKIPEIDFMIVGAEKSGTTWLANMLRQHPDIFIPEEKEVFYFNHRFFESPELHNFNHDKPISWYYSFFKDAKPGQILGEACPAYLWDEVAPQKIFEFNPNIKTVAILRNPIDRAYSQFLFYLQRGVLGEVTFEQALKMRPDILSRSSYYDQIARYDSFFPRTNIKITFYDDLTKDNRAFLIDVETFLGVEEFIPVNINERSNVTGVPRFKLLNRSMAEIRYFVRKKNPVWFLDFLRFIGVAKLSEKLRLKNTRSIQEKPEIDPELLNRLSACFQKDIENLEERTGRDLATWKQ